MTTLTAALAPTGAGARPRTVPRPLRRIRLLLCLAALSVGGAAAAAGLTSCSGDLPIFADGFELGSFCPWDFPESCPAGAQIAAVRASPDGAVDLPISGALVTAVIPQIGSDPAGFFLQAERGGPALFVAVDPATLSPVPAPGDQIYLEVAAVDTLSGLRRATAVTAWSVLATGIEADLAVDVSAATDLVTNLDGYDSEMIRLSGEVTGAFAGAGAGFESAPISTPGLPLESALRLRVPVALRAAVDLETGCQVSLCGSPLWRYLDIAEPSAWNASELALAACPAPGVVSAQATSATSVSVGFSRQIAPASVAADGSQFAFDQGLVATSASVSGRTVTVDTSAQTDLQTYTVTVAGSVTDQLGAGLDPAADTAQFSGYHLPASVQISELNANILNGCDLVELRVLAGGSLGSFVLKERVTTVLTFPSFTVATGDTIVVHFNSGNAACNPGPAQNETTSTSQYPQASYGANYDAAWDWYTSDSGVTNTDNVLTLYGATGAIVDALLASDDPTGTAAADSETQAAEVGAAGQWVPSTGLIDDGFNAAAAQDLNGTGTSAAGDSIRRSSTTDTNTKEDWSTGASSWGVVNP